MVTISKSPDCHLPTLPVPFQIVGMASPDGILVTKSDIADLARYILGLRNWVNAADACLAVQP